MVCYDNTFKVILLGDAPKEKIRLTKRYCYNSFDSSYRLTIGVEFHVKKIELNYRNEVKRVKLQIWDLGGEERFRFLMPTYCLGANGAILLYDITKPSTLDNVPEWASLVRQRWGPIPIILIGSKVDLAKTQRKIPREYVIQLAEQNNITSFVEISAKENFDVDNAFSVLTKLMVERTSLNEVNVQKPIRHIGKEFKINDFLLLRLERTKTNIYIGGRLFHQCKYLLLNITTAKIKQHYKINSIDEAAEKLDSSMERGSLYKYHIPPETEFWGHCSNIQAWYENEYDTRILHRNIAFPLLKELVRVGDPLAIKRFKEEIAIRLEEGYPPVVDYLIHRGYLNYFNNEELDTLLENPKILANLPTWFNNK